MPTVFNFPRFDNDPARPLTKPEHFRWKCVAWCYAVLWLVVGLTVQFFLPITLLIKLPIYVILFIAAPTLIDLFESYESYLKRRARRD